MNTVWKFPLPVGDGEFVMMMPRDAQVVHVGMNPAGRQIGSSGIALWAIVEEGSGPEQRTFIIVATGEELPHAAHVGTVIDYNRVWHVFETTPSRLESF